MEIEIEKKKIKSVVSVCEKTKYLKRIISALIFITDVTRWDASLIYLPESSLRGKQTTKRGLFVRKIIINTSF